MKIDTDVINEVRDYCIENKLTIAAAESATAGNIQAALSLAQNASLFFQGGIVTYNLGQKARHLDVNPVHAQECNSVSEKVAEQMARKVAALFLADYGIGITGFANTVPEENINELFAYISVWAATRKLLHKKLRQIHQQTYKAFRYSMLMRPSNY